MKYYTKRRIQGDSGGRISGLGWADYELLWSFLCLPGGNKDFGRMATRHGSGTIEMLVNQTKECDHQSPCTRLLELALCIPMDQDGISRNLVSTCG